MIDVKLMQVKGFDLSPYVFVIAPGCVVINGMVWSYFSVCVCAQMCVKEGKQEHVVTTGDDEQLVNARQMARRASG